MSDLFAPSSNTSDGQVAADLRVGDVVRYEPESRWCRDGYAIAREMRDGSIELFETYWSSGGTDNIISPDTYELLFNLGDYDEKPESVWKSYARADRQYIPVHSGYRTKYLVRKGVTPDLSTRIANAEEDVEDAESRLRSAQSSLQLAQSELARLRAEAQS